ncbi:MAG: hypothetical protein ACLU0O_06190 [Collinsella sp.]
MGYYMWRSAVRRGSQVIEVWMSRQAYGRRLRVLRSGRRALYYGLRSHSASLSRPWLLTG